MRVLSDPEEIRKFRDQHGERASRVFVVRDWPRGTRDRGWGFLHDQIWFYDSLPDGVAHQDLVLVGEDRHGVRIERTRPLTEMTTDDGIYCLPDDEGAVYRYEYAFDGVSGTVKWLRLYLDRVMLWTPWRRARLHTFFCGDDDIVHDHPWDFVTIPFTAYEEEVSGEDTRGAFVEQRRVGAFRPHWRPATYRHRVLHPERPFRTVVITGPQKRDWGFWPEPDVFVPRRLWTKYDDE